MNKINFNQTGGFPLSTQILDATQEAYKTFNAFGNLAGDLVIISGCEIVNGTTVLDGFVSINGELLPFKSGTLSTNVVIVETADSRGFEDGSVKPVIYSRYATFGTSTINYPWANFKRPQTLLKIMERLDNLEKSVPKGLVAIWGKPADQIPQGWEIYEPLKGLVPAGRKSGDPIFGSLDNVVGTAEVTLTIEQMPKHKHQSYWKQGSGGASGSGGTLVDGWKDTSEVGGDQPHTNIQPTRIVDYIVFVGF